MSVRGADRDLLARVFDAMLAALSPLERVQSRFLQASSPRPGAPDTPGATALAIATAIIAVCVLADAGLDWDFSSPDDASVVVYPLPAPPVDPGPPPPHGDSDTDATAATGGGSSTGSDSTETSNGSNGRETTPTDATCGAGATAGDCQLMRYSYRSPPPTGDFDWGGGQEFSVELHVRGAAIEKALERVAVPTLGGNRLFIPSGTSWESYGFTESRGGLRVDYASVTREAHAVVGPIAVDLLERAREQSLDLHDTVDLIASFVQKSIPYKIPPDVRRRPDGSLVATGGFLTPLAALAQKPSTAPGGWGWGDCDTKSSLLGALFGSIKGLDTVMFVGRGHAFVGVAIAPRRNDMIVEWRGRVWVLIETTARWPVGRIERDTLRHIGELEVVAI